MLVIYFSICEIAIVDFCFITFFDSEIELSVYFLGKKKCVHFVILLDNSSKMRIVSHLSFLYFL